MALQKASGQKIVVDIPPEFLRQMQELIQSLLGPRNAQTQLPTPGTSLQDLLTALSQRQVETVNSLDVQPNMPELPAPSLASLEASEEPINVAPEPIAPVAPVASAEPQGNSSFQKQWDALKKRAIDTRCARIQAEKDEKEAYDQVMEYANHYDVKARSEIPQDFLSKVSRALDKIEYMKRAEDRWNQYLAEEEKRTALLEEQRKKLQELDELRAQLNALETSAAEHRRQNPPTQPPPTRGPGPAAEARKNATEPCGKWEGPRPDLGFVRYCYICNLTAVSRTMNCPNFYLHHKFKVGTFKKYVY